MNPFELYDTPPFDAVMPATPQLIFTLIFGIAAIAAWVYAIIRARDSQSMVPIWVMLGGTLCVFAEPIVDVMGMCWFPVHGQWTYIETFGRKIPLMVGFAYICYYGGMTLITLVLFEKGMTVGQVWKWYLVSVVIEWTFEPIAIMLGLWSYYGNQPFSVFGFPLWWPPVNAVGAFAAAAIIYLIKPHLHPKATIVIVPLVVSGDLVGNAFTAWPIWTALHTTQGYVVSHAAGVVTLIMCYTAILLIAKLVAKNGIDNEMLTPKKISV
jgi:hypothetical protein